MSKKVAIVTGSNQGIGLQVVRNLCTELKNDWVVYLTARDEAKGQKAVATLDQEGLNPHFHQLDITDQASVDTFRDYLKSTYDGIDILVNNAGFAFSVDSTVSDIEQAEETMKINYFGTIRSCEAFYPLLKAHARVVIVSSLVGELRMVPNLELRAKLKSLDYDIAYLTNLAKVYVEAVRDGSYTQKGYPQSKYVMSKVLISAAAFLQQRNIDKERPGDDIVINAVHPGYVDTSMTKNAPRVSGYTLLSAEEGAKSSTFCALLPRNVEHPRGEYVIEDCSICPWERE